jgi:hypothetical protein
MIDSGHDKVKIPRRSTTVAEEIVLFELHGNLVAAGWLQEAPRKCLATTATLHGYIECWTHARAGAIGKGTSLVVWRSHPSISRLPWNDREEKRRMLCLVSAVP